MKTWTEFMFILYCKLLKKGEFLCLLVAFPYPASKGCELIVKFSSTSSSLGGNYLSLKSANFPIRVSVCTCDLEIINTWYNITSYVKANGRRTNFLGMKMVCLVSPELYYYPFSTSICCVGCSSICLDWFSAELYFKIIFQGYEFWGFLLFWKVVHLFLLLPVNIDFPTITHFYYL